MRLVYALLVLAEACVVVGIGDQLKRNRRYPPGVNCEGSRLSVSMLVLAIGLIAAAGALYE